MNQLINILTHTKYLALAIAYAGVAGIILFAINEVVQTLAGR